MTITILTDMFFCTFFTIFQYKIYEKIDMIIYRLIPLCLIAVFGGYERRENLFN